VEEGLGGGGGLFGVGEIKKKRTGGEGGRGHYCLGGKIMMGTRHRVRRGLELRYNTRVKGGQSVGRKAFSVRTITWNKLRGKGEDSTL